MQDDDVLRKRWGQLHFYWKGSPKMLHHIHRAESLQERAYQAYQRQYPGSYEQGHEACQRWFWKYYVRLRSKSVPLSA